MNFESRIKHLWNPYYDFAGTEPFSEPESHFHKEHIIRLNNLKAYVSYHSYGEKIIYPYSMSNSAEAKNKAELDFMAQLMRNVKNGVMIDSH